MQKLIYLLLAMALFSGCEFRDQLKERKQEEADKAADHNYDRERDRAAEEQAALLEKLLKEFEAKRQYFYAIQGEYEGRFEAVSDGVKNNDTSTQKPIHSNISFRVQVENDLVKFTDENPPTPDQVKTQIDALTFGIEVEEATFSDDSTTPITLVLCTLNGIKPDYLRGSISFKCENAAVGAERRYQFFLDDDAVAVDLERSKKTASRIAPEVSLRLMDGELKKILLLNVSIRSVLGSEFFGQLREK